MNDSEKKWHIPFALGILSLLMLVSFVYFGSDGKQASVGGETVDMATLVVDGSPVIGSTDAPVIVVEFADFQCPFCGLFAKNTYSQIKSQYIDTGKVKFVYRNFAFLGLESQDSANAAYCAQDQGKFWEYHDYLYSHQNGENEGAFIKDNLKKFAQDLGLDSSSFDSCVDFSKYQDRVTADIKAGRDAGVTGTPTVFIGGKLISGAQGFQIYADAIEAQLSK
ncbi:MAG: DsbA family protein [Candidatus Spechtbacteria bacterium]|nr:DsbA family protein [Candidatus Spechtbacteria bacterium]